MKNDQIVKTCAAHYLESNDFNGITLGNLATNLGTSPQSLRDPIRKLVEDGKIHLLGPETGNPHMLASTVTEGFDQLQLLDSPHTNSICVYVAPKLLKDFVPDNLYSDQPYKRMLALGEPQFGFRSFDLIVLEHYRNDPRYLYENRDICGRICAIDSESEQPALSESNRVVLKTYGFAYDEAMNRAVAVFLRYLARLSPSHQQIWHARQLGNEYRLHPAYYDVVVVGSWKPNTSICDALLGELCLINRMTEAMGRPTLFKVDFGELGVDKPSDFNLLIRPTQKEFQAFVSLLDRTLSDNLRHKFFGSDISFTYEEARKDGTVETKRKGTLRALGEWLKQSYNVSDDSWDLIDKNLSVLWEVRKLRQRPAHAIDDNKFDQDLFRQQRELVARAHAALRTIRMMMESHPAVQDAGIKIPDSLSQENIYAY